MRNRIISDFTIFGFATYGILWTIAESFGAFFDKLKPEGMASYAILVLVSIAVGAYRSWPRTSVLIDVPNSDSSVEIRFGDLFDDSEAVVIPVNEFFDGKLGDHVSEKSLHGKFIRNVLGGQSSTFNSITENALKNVESVTFDRKNGRKGKYPIGTTAVVNVNDCRYFLTALSRTNVETLKASASLHELWDTLAGLWTSIRNHSNGYTVKVPLLGSGLSGVGIPPKQLVHQILTSFFYYSKQGKISGKVIIVLSLDIRGDIDLIEIKRNWS